MTAPAVTPRVQYTADGGLGPLVIPWPFYDDDDLLVYDGETDQAVELQAVLYAAVVASRRVVRL